jgi:hypothetical protein
MCYTLSVTKGRYQGMRKTIYFGSLVACFLLLMIPSISAIQVNTAEEAYKRQVIGVYDDGDNDDLEALIEAIRQRIDELKGRQDVSFLHLGLLGLFSDPDGPFKGGLDDIYDWTAFLFAVYGVFIFLHNLQEAPPNEVIEDFFDALKEMDVFKIAYSIILLFGYISIPVNVIMLLGDAFDVIDPDEDSF